MTLPASAPWRIVQALGICICVAMSVGLLCSGHWTFFDQNLLLNEMLEMAEETRISQMEEEVEFIKLVLAGPFGITVATVVVSIFTSCVVLVEKRWLSVFFALAHLALFGATISFGAMAMMSRDHAVSMTTKMLACGIQDKYAVFDKVEAPAVDRWRAFVDRIQLHGKCCGGSNGYKNYAPLFPLLNVSDGNKAMSTRLPCVCRDNKRVDCGIQHPPFPCCKRVNDLQSINPFCSVNVFGNLATSKACKNISSAKLDYYTNGCDQAAVKDRPHIFTMLLYSIANLTMSFAALILGTILALLASKTKRIGQISEAKRAPDTKSADKLADVSVYPSVQSHRPSAEDIQRLNRYKRPLDDDDHQRINRYRRPPPGPQDESSLDGPQRLSSDRFQSRQYKYVRPPDSTRRSVSQATPPLSRGGPARSAGTYVRHGSKPGRRK